MKIKSKFNELNADSSINSMLEALSTDGIFVVRNYINDIKPLYDEVLDLCLVEAGHYEFGRNFRGPALDKFNRNSQIWQVYNKAWMRNLCKQYHKSDNAYGINVFATYDYKYNEELARNGYLHFDRLWRLKFMIYLMDIQAENGAFFCSPGSVQRGETLRTANRDANRIDVHHKHEINDYPPVPVEGKAGTLLVFDTDMFHKGGIVKEDKKRLIVSIHFYTNPYFYII